MLTSARPLAQPIPPARPDLTAVLWRRSLKGDRGFGATIVEGRLPEDLRGTLYRNGPGLFESFGQRYAHPFEGDGAITALRIDADGARAATKIHDTRGLVEERAAGKPLYNLGVPWLRRVTNALRGKDKNTANTNVMWWQGRLFALMEAGKPTELDPVTLRTAGETDLDGVITSWFSAHPHRSARRRTTYNFGLSFGRVTRIHVYALPDEGAARQLAAIDLPFGPMLHDFIATDEHLIFFVAPAKISIPRAFFNVGGFESFFTWRPELGTDVIVVPIDDPTRVVRFHTDAFWQWHFTNASSRGAEITVDYVRYPDFSSFAALARPDLGGTEHAALAAARYHRARIDLAAKRFTSEELLAGESCEFPRVHPAVEGAAHRYAWITLGDLDGIGRLDTATGALASHRLGPHQRTSEPIFVPRAGATPGDETDGHVLALSYDGARDESFVAVYDGRRVADGPVARVWLGYAVPITFHGTWVPS
jgi:all-trans-8'-apo-beta-carotenal 15,15'-oxygenase